MDTPGYNLCSTQIFALRGLVMVCMGGIMMIVMLHARYPFYVNNFVAVPTVNIVPLNRRWARYTGPYGCPEYVVHRHNRVPTVVFFPLYSIMERRTSMIWSRS
jgi:hypothetical protein